MRLLYDVTFNGAPRPLPSGHNSPAGPSGFFPLRPSTNREKSKRSRNAFPRKRKREFHGEGGGGLGGDPFDEGHRFTELRILEKREEKTIGLKHCDLSQLR